MISPSVQFIYAARDSLKDTDYLELYANGLSEQKKQYFLAFGAAATEEGYEQYALGLMVARVLLLGMPAAVMNHVEI